MWSSHYGAFSNVAWSSVSGSDTGGRGIRPELPRTVAEPIRHPLLPGRS
ncbi:hypothetical protein ABZ858_08925 [Streptomyces sp. NPDC047017]